ncbi:MAG: type II secretion system protein GspN, partial [Nitrospira sp.]|nr:type II secretion system protein GspN [Nitrospira sp.]
MIPTPMTWFKERKEIVGWIAAGICLCVLSLIATFPFGSLQTRLLSEFNRTTGIDASITNWSVAWPLGIEWQQVTLSGSDGVPVQLAFVQTKLGILKALSGDLGLDIVAQLDESSSTTGLATVTLSASSFSLREPISVAGQLRQIDLSRILRQYVTHGVLNGTFSHRLDSGRQSGSTLKGEGQWTADATDLNIEHIPLGHGRTLSLSFANVSAELICRDAVCDVTGLSGDGNDGSFTGEGTITVQQPLLNSQLALTMTIIPGAGFASKATSLGLPPLPVGSP